MNESKIKILKRLSTELDPFQGPTTEQKSMLSTIGITKFDDPFYLTNEIIARLEDALNPNRPSSKRLRQ